MKMRDKIKKPMTDKALQIMLKKLKGLSKIIYLSFSLRKRKHYIRISE